MIMIIISWLKALVYDWAGPLTDVSSILVLLGLTLVGSKHHKNETASNYMQQTCCLYESVFFCAVMDELSVHVYVGAGSECSVQSSLADGW